MGKFRELYTADIHRYGSASVGRGTKKVLYYFRKAQTTQNSILRLWYRWRFAAAKKRFGLELYYGTKIGPGLYLGHPYNITVNASAVIGSNVNIHKGVTIGQENRGRRKGTPTIGNCVWIGINAVIVGNVKIGNDVLIAPGSFVNCDVPDHSVVFGNPCVIKPCDHATAGYINNIVE